jgi:hypothetical protein
MMHLCQKFGKYMTVAVKCVLKRASVGRFPNIYEYLVFFQSLG